MKSYRVLTLNNVNNFLFILLLTLMINTPLLLKPLKAGILLLLIIVFLIKLKNNNIFIYKDIFLLFSITLVASSLFSFNGAIKITENPFALSTVSFLFPLIWMFIISSLLDRNILNKIHKLLILSTYFLTIYIILFILNQIGIIPDSLFITLETNNQSGFYYRNGQMEFSLLCLASLMFLIPYYYSSILFNEKISYIQGIFLILITLIFILSGRRGLQLAVLISFFNIYLLIFFIKNKTIKKKIKNRKRLIKRIIYIGLSIIVPYTIIFNVIDYYSIYTFFLDGFDFTNQDNFSSFTRLKVFYSLYDVWTNNPLFGGGYGSHGDIIRNTSMPWAYELTYNALLAQIGLIGILLYFCTTIWIIWQLTIIIKSQDIRDVQISFSFLVGMISFLVASASNSYLTKFDYLWVIFIPLIVINIYKYNKN